jgi:hypothetical protein
LDGRLYFLGRLLSYEMPSMNFIVVLGFSFAEDYTISGGNQGEMWIVETGRLFYSSLFYSSRYR